MTKFIATVLSLILMLSAIPAAYATEFTPAAPMTSYSTANNALTASTFPDVPYWAKTAVEWAVNNKITAGGTDGNFGSNLTVTRAQAVTFLYAYNGFPALKSTNNPYTDVKPNKYYYNAVLWATQNGIAAGTNAAKTTFSPNKTCTIPEILCMMYAMAGRPAIPSNFQNPYVNVHPDFYFYNALMWCVRENLYDSIPSNIFPRSGNKNPDGDCTRATTVTLLYNYCKGNPLNNPSNDQIKNNIEKMAKDADGFSGKTPDVDTTTAWCARFASKRATNAGISGINSASCTTLIKQFMEKKSMYVIPTYYDDTNWKNYSIWSSAYPTGAFRIWSTFMPRRGDFVFFAAGKTTATENYAKHVGIVSSVSRENGKIKITVVEGNSDPYKVVTNTYTFSLSDGKTGKGSNVAYIVGFGRIK